MHHGAKALPTLMAVVLIGCTSPPHPIGAKDASVSQDDTSSSTSNQYPEVLKGVWLIGKFAPSPVRVSWVRLPTPTAPGVLTQAWVLAGSDIAGNVPLWNCQGETTWSIGTNRAIYIDLDQLSCGSTPIAPYGYYFTDFTKPNGPQVPVGANLVVTVRDRDTSEELLAYRFPASWCDRAMTKCRSPF